MQVPTYAIERALTGLAFPATCQSIRDRAQHTGNQPHVRVWLDRLPERTYQDLGDITAQLRTNYQGTR